MPSHRPLVRPRTENCGVVPLRKTRHHRRDPRGTKPQRRNHRRQLLVEEDQRDPSKQPPKCRAKEEEEEEKAGNRQRDEDPRPVSLVLREKAPPSLAPIMPFMKWTAILRMTNSTMPLHRVEILRKMIPVNRPSQSLVRRFVHLNSPLKM